MSACLFCGNTHFEEEDGVLVCTNCGRAREGGPLVAEDDADFGTQGKTRTLKIERKKIKVRNTYTGTRAYRLYLQAWQYILWHQCHLFCKEIGLGERSAELWAVARDLWTLRLSHLVTRLETVEEVTQGSVSEDNTQFVQTESQSLTAETEISNQNGLPSTASSSRQALKPCLWDTVSTLYISCLLCRLDIPLHRMYDFVSFEKLPFVRAVRYVPRGMRERLPSEYQLALDTVSIPTRLELSSAVQHLANEYRVDFNLDPPMLDTRTLLQHYASMLHLPIESCVAAAKLQELIDYCSQARADSASTRSERKTRRSPIACAEIRIMSLLIVAVKLLFPFDNQTKPGVDLVRLDWLRWSQTLEKKMKNKNSNVIDGVLTGALRVNTEDILKMDDTQRDEYMQWYEETWSLPTGELKDTKTELEQQILASFPTPLASKSRSKTRLDARGEQDTRPKSTIHHALQLPAQYSMIRTPRVGCTAEGESILDPKEDDNGSRYRVYLSQSSLGAGPALTLHEKAAELACTDIKHLLNGIRYSERLLEEWAVDCRRSEYFAKQ